MASFSPTPVQLHKVFPRAYSAEIGEGRGAGQKTASLPIRPACTNTNFSRNSSQMVDFSQLLRKPLSDVKRPPPLPMGDYPAIIKSYEFGESNRNKTPRLSLRLVLIDWPDTIPLEDRDGIDISKRQLSKDYYLTEDALWRLADFMRSCGLTGTVEENVPSLEGQQVLAEVQYYTNKQTGEIGNQIGKLVGLE